MRQDLRFALRMIASHRWFSAVVVATIALGIGLNTMVFTLVNAVLFKPVPLPRGERLVAISNRPLNEADGRRNVSYPDFRDYRAQATSMDGLEAVMMDEAVLSERANPPQHYQLGQVSAGLFDMLHVQPIVGRGFRVGEDKPGAEPVVLIGYGVWKDRYASSPTIAGRQVRVNEKPATIVGVMPEGFKFPENQDLWIPLATAPAMEDRSRRSLLLFGILKPDTPIAQARANLDAVAQRLSAQYPAADKGFGIAVETFHQRFNGGPIRLTFLLMLAAVACVLLVACANVANMMLSRALARQREISIRVAMGASRWQVVRQLLVESILLSVLGGAFGMGLSALGVHGFDLATRDVGKPYWIQFAMDYTAFAYFGILCVASGILFGLAPALRVSRVDLNSSLKDGTRTAGSQRGGKLSGILVVFQFALTLVLLTGTGVFVRSFLEYQSLNRWVPASHLLTARVNLSKERYPNDEARIRFFEQLLPRLRAIPGVTNAVSGSALPGLGGGSRRIETDRVPVTDPSHAPMATVLVQSPGYFAATNLAILHGRDFNETDGTPGHRAAVVTQEFAERFWPHDNAEGKRLRFFTDNKPGEWVTVTGVTANIVQRPQDPSPDPLLFLPYRQEGYNSMALLVRTQGDPSSTTAAVRAAVQGLNEDLPLYQVQTLSAAIDRQQWYIRLFGSLFLMFAVIALVIASVGIYAVMAQSTNRRTQEIGVRMALGATPRSIAGLVVSRGVKQVLIGMALGLAAAFPAVRLMSTLGLRVSPTDPVIFLSVSLLLMAIGVFACWLPARRAASMNPVQAIRYE